MHIIFFIIPVLVFLVSVYTSLRVVHFYKKTGYKRRYFISYKDLKHKLENNHFENEKEIAEAEHIILFSEITWFLFAILIISFIVLTVINNS